MTGQVPGLERTLPARNFALRRDTVLADGERFFRQVQPAVDYAQDSVYVGPGTFSESVEITTSGLYFAGFGRNTIISSSSGPAVSVTSAGTDVMVESLTANTSDGTATAAIDHNGERGRVQTCTSDGNNATTGVALTADRQYAIANSVYNVGGVGVRSDSSYSVVTGNIIVSPSTDGIRAQTIGNDISTNIIYDPGDDGVEASGAETIIGTNRIAFADGDGINATADDQVVSSNIVGGGGGGGSGANGILLDADGQLVGHNRVLGSTDDDYSYGSATNIVWGPNASGDGTEGAVSGSLTVTAGDGLEGGGSVALGGSTTLNAQEPFCFNPGMESFEDGLSNVEIGRIDLQAGETLSVERIEFRQQGGGSSANASIDVRDVTAAATIGTQTLGGTTKDAGSSGSGNTVIVRVSNSTGGPIDAAPMVTGFISGA